MRGGSPGGRPVVPLLARGVPLCMHGEVADDTAVDTVDCRRQAAGRGRYRTQGSADYRTRRQRLRVGAEGQVPVVFSSIKLFRHPLRPIQPHETVRPVRCFWGVRGAPSCGSRACCAQGARRPGVVWVPVRACTGSMCGVPAGDCAAGRPPSLLWRCRLRGGLSLGTCGTCGGWASGAVRGSHCGRRPVSGASYLRHLAVSGLGERYRRRSSGPRRSRPGPGADPGGSRRER